MEVLQLLHTKENTHKHKGQEDLRLIYFISNKTWTKKTQDWEG